MLLIFQTLRSGPWGSRMPRCSLRQRIGSSNPVMIQNIIEPASGSVLGRSNFFAVFLPPAGSVPWEVH